MDMKQIVFATNNAHKLREVREVLAGAGVAVTSLADVGIHDDIPETATTLEGNAVLKARWVKERYGHDCFADDTGLEVRALGGEPGVYSARYAGPGHDSGANTALLLRRLAGVADRRARFRTVVALCVGDAAPRLFEGVVEGAIAHGPHGAGGFGYDPVFRPDEAGGPTFAEMTDADKNAISHRGRAVRALADYLSANP